MIETYRPREPILIEPKRLSIRAITLVSPSRFAVIQAIKERPE